MRDIHTWTVFLVFETNKLVAMNARGDAFTCRDGSSYTFHIEKVRDAYE